MPKITDMEVRVTFTMDNGERVKTLINSDGSAMGWGASTEAVGETVDLREALAQVVYEAHVAREDGEAEPEAESLEASVGATYPLPEVGKRYLLTGELWANYDLRGEVVTVAGVAAEDAEFAPFFRYGADGSLRGFLDPYDDGGYAYEAKPFDLDSGK